MDFAIQVRHYHIHLYVIGFKSWEKISNSWVSQARFPRFPESGGIVGRVNSDWWKLTMPSSCVSCAFGGEVWAHFPNSSW